MTARELMEAAIAEAKKAGERGEVPVGAVIARQGLPVASSSAVSREMISAAGNTVEERKSPVCHAEINAINAACAALGTKWLNDCVMYVTLEPCPMCAGAIIAARLGKLVFGAYDAKAGSVFSVQEMYRLPYNHLPEVQAGFMEEECSLLLTDFFKKLRG